MHHIAIFYYSSYEFNLRNMSWCFLLYIGFACIAFVLFPLVFLTLLSELNILNEEWICRFSLPRSLAELCSWLWPELALEPSETRKWERKKVIRLTLKVYECVLISGFFFGIFLFFFLSSITNHFPITNHFHSNLCYIPIVVITFFCIELGFYGLAYSFFSCDFCKFIPIGVYLLLWLSPYHLSVTWWHGLVSWLFPLVPFLAYSFLILSWTAVVESTFYFAVPA